MIQNVHYMCIYIYIYIYIYIIKQKNTYTNNNLQCQEIKCCYFLFKMFKVLYFANSDGSQ